MARTILCADSLPWLESECPPCAIVSSPPLALELGLEMEAWVEWYRRALELMFRAAAPGAPCVVYQTDQKHRGRWVSSFRLIAQAAEAAGMGLLWHKIVLRREPGKVDLHRPGFSHLCAFGGEGAKPGAATEDVMRRGAVLYPNAMGLIPARLACEFAGRHGVPIVDPFCGRGTVPAVAEALGFDAIGLDIDPAQAEAAQALKLQIRQ